jgi:hypothetical protein
MIAMQTVEIDDSVYISTGYRKEELIKAKEKFNIEVSYAGAPEGGADS